MNIATQLHRENHSLYDIYKKASLYCYPVIERVNSDFSYVSFTFSDNSRIKMKADKFDLLFDIRVIDDARLPDRGYILPYC